MMILYHLVCGGVLFDEFSFRLLSSVVLVTVLWYSGDVSNYLGPVVVSFFSALMCPDDF